MADQNQGWSQRDFVRAAVLLWGDRGPQPLFDVISTLCTISPRALACVGVHASASVTIAPNAKVPRALVPVCSDEVGVCLLPPGRVSVCPRVPRDAQGFLRGHYQRYLDGELGASDLDSRAQAAIHILDMDFTDPDNTVAMLCLVRALRSCGGAQQRRPLFVFVSRRKMGAQLAPLQVNASDSTDGALGSSSGVTSGPPQFCVNDGTVPPTSYVIADSVAPYIKEGAWESAYHNTDDMHTFGLFAHGVLSRHLQLAGLRDRVRLGVNGSFEIAGVSSNVHKLEWYFFNQDGSYVDLPEYSAREKDYWQAGIVGAGRRSDNGSRCVGGSSVADADAAEGSRPQNVERQRLFRNKCAEFIEDGEEIVDVDDMVEYLRSHCGRDAKGEAAVDVASAGASAENKSGLPEIFVHCAGPMFLLSELAKHDDLRHRVTRIGSMFLAHDGEANLLGRNFNEGVAAKLTEALWGEDGQNIHRLFPNAEVLCVTTETCKAEGLTLVPPPSSESWG